MYFTIEGYPFLSVVLGGYLVLHGLIYLYVSNCNPGYHLLSFFLSFSVIYSPSSILLPLPSFFLPFHSLPFSFRFPSLFLLFLFLSLLYHSMFLFFIIRFIQRDTINFDDFVNNGDLDFNLICYTCDIIKVYYFYEIMLIILVIINNSLFDPSIVVFVTSVFIDLITIGILLLF